jgi:hypothetical protein
LCCQLKFNRGKIMKLFIKGFILDNVDEFIDSNGSLLDIRVIKFLLENGYTVNFDKLLNINLTFLDHSGSLYDRELINLLLEHGAIPDSDRIKLVIKTGDIWLIKVFLKYNIDLTIASKELSAEKNKYHDLIEMFRNNVDQDLLLAGLFNRCCIDEYEY